MSNIFFLFGNKACKFRPLFTLTKERLTPWPRFMSDERRYEWIGFGGTTSKRSECVDRISLTHCPETNNGACLTAIRMDIFF